LHKCRLDKVRNRLEKAQLDGLLITKPENMYYVSGFTGSEGAVVLTTNKAYLVVDFRYKEQAENEAPCFEIVVFNTNSLFRRCGELITLSSVKSLGFEAQHLTVKDYNKMLSSLNNIQVFEADYILEELRSIKEPDEVEKIIKAQEITDQTFAHIIEYIKTGVSEKELELEMEYYMRNLGAQGTAFKTIIASGPRSSLPHGIATNRKLQEGDLITFDFGARFLNYCSDMTRTVILGTPNKKQIEIYEIVLEAQEAALNYIKSQVFGKDVDKIARDIINNYGFKQNFGHSLGHGVGLEIHENPYLSPKSESNLLSGMVVTIEPGIYIQNLGGVRIEDMVIITDDGCKNITSSPKQLICI
jgi:Xaa-Pro aminopeptidase